MRGIELLAPAGNADIAIQAVKHGADAVYIGAPTHGARRAASNSLQDIRRAIEFAHTYNARVYVTVNTIIYENELREVERMIRDLHAIGTDALIVQDMGILRMDIPPIALHASTQCDIRTPEKAKFLEEAGFSQLVLARELSTAEIKEICKTVAVPVETFVHGALCVSHSGRCGAGYASAARSGNRGECPQVCRQAFTLRDARGKIIAKDKYLLSLKDFRADSQLEELIKAGVTSFKIEGRLKEESYVKNITAHYNNRLNEIIEKYGERGEETLTRTSSGTVNLTFTPQPEKSFNRGFTTFMLSGQPDTNGMASVDTPKSLGEPITDPSQLKNGDGISYFDRKGEYTGTFVNGASFRLPKGVEIRRTSSVEWKKLMSSETATRTIATDIEMEGSLRITARDSEGNEAAIKTDEPTVRAQKPTDYRKIFEKTGGTPFRLNSFINRNPELFFPASKLTALRRELLEKLEECRKASRKTEKRRPENRDYPYPGTSLSYRDNAANTLAEAFYRDHGVKDIEPALETADIKTLHGKTLTVMTSRHCMLRELGLCLKSKPGIQLPLSLESGPLRLQPRFDCTKCEMHIDMKI